MPYHQPRYRPPSLDETHPVRPPRSCIALARWASCGVKWSIVEMTDRSVSFSASPGAVT
jgi:hypothetical protein